MTEHKPDPTPTKSVDPAEVDALAEQTTEALTSRAAEPHPEPADAPPAFATAHGRDVPSKRVAALLVALVTIALRRLGIDPETLMQIAEIAVSLGLAAHYWLQRRQAPGIIADPEAYAAAVKAGRVTPTGKVAP